MISLIAQERLLGAALGSVMMGGVILEQRRGIYRSLSQYEESAAKYRYLPREPMFGRNTRAELTHMWNKAVDRTFKPVIQYLSSRGL